MSTDFFVHEFKTIRFFLLKTYYTYLQILFRYVAMEKIRPSSDKLKVLLTNKGMYIVRSGPPSIENIEFHVEYSLFVDAVPMVQGSFSYNILIFHEHLNFLISQKSSM